MDAGSIGLALSDAQRRSVRDIIVTHPHMDHIASLPIFVDDLFGELTEPIRIHATEEVVDLLERDVFNDNVYPRFAELRNQHGPVMEYMPFKVGKEFSVGHLRATAVEVNHIVPTVGLVVTDGRSTVAFSSDTAATDKFWTLNNKTLKLNALFIEASFPNSMHELAKASKHLTPQTMAEELTKLSHNGIDILAVHLKAAYRATLVKEIEALGIKGLSVMEAGRVYEW